MYQMTRRCFDALEEWADAHAGLAFRADYRGRAMDGDCCLAMLTHFPARDALLLARFVLDDLYDPDTDVDDLFAALSDPRQDQCGLDSVVYWPRVTVETA